MSSQAVKVVEREEGSSAKKASLPPSIQNNELSVEIKAYINQRDLSSNIERKLKQASEKGFITEEDECILSLVKSEQKRNIYCNYIFHRLAAQDSLDYIFSELRRYDLMYETIILRHKQEKDPFVQLQNIDQQKYEVYTRNLISQAQEAGVLPTGFQERFDNIPMSKYLFKYHLALELADKAEAKIYCQQIIQEAESYKLFNLVPVSFFEALEDPNDKLKFLEKKICPLIALHKKCDSIINIAFEYGIINKEETERFGEILDPNYKMLRIRSLEIEEKIHVHLEQKEEKRILADCENLINLSRELDLVSKSGAEEFGKILPARKRLESLRSLEKQCLDILRASRILADAVEYGVCLKEDVQQIFIRNNNEEILCEAANVQNKVEKIMEINKALDFCSEYGFISRLYKKILIQKSDLDTKLYFSKKYLEIYRNREEIKKDYIGTLDRVSRLPEE